MEPPHAAAVEDKPLSQPEAVGTEPPDETEDEAKEAGGEDGARDKRRAGHHEPEELHVPTVREAKQSARRLTEREKRRRERRRRMVRLLSAATFAVIMIAALLLTYFVLIIDKIEVYGCERFTEEEIIAASGLSTGQHMWFAKLGAAKAAVEADPYIASLEITRVYPDKLVLRVTERKEKVVILGMNTHAVIDGEGYVLSIGTRASYEGLLKVYGTGRGRLSREPEAWGRIGLSFPHACNAACGFGECGAAQCCGNAGYQQPAQHHHDDLRWARRAVGPAG